MKCNGEIDIDNFLFRNVKHDDINCPYDLHDGWEYLDPVTGNWLEDDTIRVLCVKP